MHRTPSLPRTVRPPESAESGFSLVEITLAIGIIAFAFVALFGLLPSGLSVFRQSIDAANEMWIMQDLNTMIQVTDWSKDSGGKSKVEALAFSQGGLIYFYDEEGRLIDTAQNLDPSGTSEIELKRLYAVKLEIDRAERPGGGTGGDDRYIPNTYRVIAIFAPYTNPAALKEFQAILKPDDLKQLKKGTALKTRSFIVSRMGSQKE